jgi:ABC-type Zn uptake system ZnuABC Zn-binding protein ZnuA
MIKVKKADVVLKIGLGLDLWMDKIIDGSRNSDLNVVDCSKNIVPLEVLTFKPDARYGDIHQFGNPHYWLTPDNVAPITLAIMDGFITADPENAEKYIANRAEYLDQFESSISEIKKEAEFLKGQEAVFYHNSWPYFNAFTGLIPAAFIEPYPGVPASPSHVAEVIRLVRDRAIPIIIMEPFFDRRVPEKIAAETGAKVLIVYPSVGGRNKDETYLQWLKGNIDALKGVLQ